MERRPGSDEHQLVRGAAGEPVHRASKRATLFAPGAGAPTRRRQRKGGSSSPIAARGLDVPRQRVPPGRSAPALRQPEPVQPRDGRAPARPTLTPQPTPTPAGPPLPRPPPLRRPDPIHHPHRQIYPRPPLIPLPTPTPPNSPPPPAPPPQTPVTAPEVRARPTGTQACSPSRSAPWRAPRPNGQHRGGSEWAAQGTE